jgi:hypothetical protein
MLSLLPYIVLNFNLGFFTASLTIPVFCTVVIHYLFIRPIWGWGSVDERDAEYFYLLVSIMFAALGNVLAFLHHLPGPGMLKRLYPGTMLPEDHIYTAVRWCKCLFFAMLLGLSLIAYEVLPQYRWEGWFVSLVFILIVNAFVYVMMRPFWKAKTGGGKMAAAPPKDWHLVFYDTLYWNTSPTVDISLQVAIYLSIFDFLAVGFFGLLTCTTNLWSVAIAIVLFGILATCSAVTALLIFNKEKKLTEHHHVPFDSTTGI